MKTLPEKCFEFIAQEEGCRLQAYPDIATGGAPWTVGYGATGSDIDSNTKWTQEECDADLKRRISALLVAISRKLPRTLPDDAMVSLVSLAYNIGLPRLLNSTLMKYVVSGRYLDAAIEFQKWCLAAGKPLHILKARRSREMRLFKSALEMFPADGA